MLNKIFISFAVAAILFFNASIVLADQTQPSPNENQAITDLQNQAASLNKLNAESTGKETLQVLAGRIIQSFLAIFGSLSLILFIYAGFLWMTSAGNAERVEKAKKIMLWTTLGIVVILSSYIIVKFLFSDIFKR